MRQRSSILFNLQFVTDILANIPHHLIKLRTMDSLRFEVNLHVLKELLEIRIL